MEATAAAPLRERRRRQFAARLSDRVTRGRGCSQAVTVLPARHVGGGHVPELPAHQEAAAAPSVRQEERDGAGRRKQGAAEDQTLL